MTPETVPADIAPTAWDWARVFRNLHYFKKNPSLPIGKAIEDIRKSLEQISILMGEIGEQQASDEIRERLQKAAGQLRLAVKDSEPAFMPKIRDAALAESDQLLEFYDLLERSVTEATSRDAMVSTIQSFCIPKAAVASDLIRMIRANAQRDDWKEKALSWTNIYRTTLIEERVRLAQMP